MRKVKTLDYQKERFALAYTPSERNARPWIKEVPNPNVEPLLFASHGHPQNRPLSSRRILRKKDRGNYRAVRGNASHGHIVWVASEMKGARYLLTP
jgi:hypothetical protein